MSINLSKEKHHMVPVRYKAPNNKPNINTWISNSDLNLEATCPLVKEEEIFTNLMKVIMTMKEDPSFLNPGSSGYYKKFRWSFYEPFGIPQYSITNDCMKINYKTLFKRFNKRGNWQSYFRGTIRDNNILDNFFNNPPGTSAFNLFTEYSSKYRQMEQPNNLYLITNWQLPNTINDKKDYKIHFCVKEEYVLYTLMKAISIMNNRAKEKTKKTGIEYRTTGKIMTTLEYSIKPSQYMPGIINTYPSIVIYTSTDNAEEVKEILEEFIRAFPESEEIGLCELGDSQRIPYGNIRLNKLICFAKGDRAMKLNEVRSDIQYGRLSKKTIPPWILEMVNTCKQSDEVNKRSQNFFGLNICDNNYSSILSESKCDIQPFCYLSQSIDCLDPNTIKGIKGLEPTDKYTIHNPSESNTQQPDTVKGGRKRTRKLRKKSKSTRCGS